MEKSLFDLPSCFFQIYVNSNIYIYIYIQKDLMKQIQ